MGRRRGGGGGGGAKGGGGGMFGRKAGGNPAKAKAPPPRAAAPPPPQARAPPPPMQQPMAAAPAPAPAAGGGGMMSGLGGMVAQGMALGVGSSIGHKAVDGAMGMFSGGSDEAAPAPQQAQEAPQPYPTTQQFPQQGGYNINPNDACAVDQKQLYQCLQEQNNNAQACNFYFEALRSCQENQQFASQ